MHWGLVILPDLSWPQAAAAFREAEERGFTTAWTYDHLSWRSLRDGPWLGAVPLLSAAAAVTSTLRLGTLVASPNYRHPALLAKDIMTLDRISDGRVDLGIGAGGTGFDADVLGVPTLTPGQRAARFEEFADCLDLLLREPEADFSGEWFTVVESRTHPGCVQQPRVPFTVAASGPRAMRVVARLASRWVTFGPLGNASGPDEWFAGVADQTRRLEVACHEIGRDPAEVRRMALLGLDLTWATGTIAALDDTADRLAALGFTDIAVHRPRVSDPELPGLPPTVYDELGRRLSQSADQ